MNFWERKVHGAFKCNLTFLNWQIKGSPRHNSILQQMFQPNYVQFKQSQVPQWYIMLHIHQLERFLPFCQPWMKNSCPGLQVQFIIWARLANVNIWVKFWSWKSEVFKINTKYLPFLVYNQVYNSFVCTLCPCLTSLFCNETESETTAKFPLARHDTGHV